MTHMLNGSLVSFAAPSVTLEVQTFRDKCNAFDDSTVAVMVDDIRDSFNRRDSFEGANANISSSSYAVNRDKVLNNAVAVARFFLALGVTASSVIERKVSANAMFNAKALKKVVELARFAVLGEKKIEKVMTAFIVCGLAFQHRNEGAISNKFNKSFLSGLKFENIVSDPELADYIADYQHKFMSGGKDTQSSQARNVLDVLGLGSIMHCENRSRGGIELATDHAFFAQFTDAFC